MPDKDASARKLEDLRSVRSAGSTAEERGSRPNRPLPLGPAFRAKQTTDLHRRVSEYMDGGALKLILTNNKTVMVSVTRDPKRRRYKARIHLGFVDAPDEVVEQLALYIVNNDPQASAAIGYFIDGLPQRPAPLNPRRQPTQAERTDGKVHDLRAIFDQLNEAYFDGSVRCRISWGRDVRRGKARRSIRVGSFSLEDDLIRVHPGLDQEWVPGFYVQWVIYHEMLHAMHPIPVVNGRRRFHTPAFSKEERQFCYFNEAVGWERRNLPALLSI